MLIGEELKAVINSKSKTFLAFCFSFILGVGVASLFDAGRSWLTMWYCALFACVIVSVIFWPDTRRRFICLCLFFCILGLWRFTITNLPVSFQLEQSVTFDATIVSEPIVKFAETEYLLASSALVGKISLKLPSYPAYSYGDRLDVSCYLSAPKNSLASDFEYDKYLAMRGVWSVCDTPEVKYLGRQKTLLGAIFSVKNIVTDRVSLLWAEPESSLIGGLLYGDRAGLSKELTENFNRVGLSHIIAVSGYNISIICSVLMSLLIFIGLYRRQAFWIAVIGIILFVLFTGASSSAVRAGIMGGVVLLGQYVGRPSKAVGALVFAGTVMVFANPFILFWDAGFQLSVAATAGILLLAGNGGVIRTTLSAIAATLPLIIYNFGRLSIVALPVNVIVLWLVPYLMLFGFFSIVASYVFWPLGQVLAWVTGFGLKYIIMLADFLGTKAWSSLNWTVPWWLVLLSYVLLYRIYLWQNKK
jgi:competence protein ComEC